MASEESPPVYYWSLRFLQPAPPRDESQGPRSKTALIILNQPFSKCLLRRLWHASDWHCCADGGANRLHDLLLPPPPLPDAPTGWIARLASWVFMRAPLRRTEVEEEDYLPDLIKGDLDSLREDGVPVVQDDDQDSTDLTKCIRSLQEKEEADGADTPYDVVLLGGLSGRLDQTVHTLSYLHKLRKSGRRIFAVTDDNVGWVLDEGKHHISIDHSILGQTCGLLPVGVDSTVLTTRGLRWNLTKETSGFDGLVSTSNHLVPEEDTVFVETSRPIWWVAELRRENI
ncbi:thiamine pyrophosphokinase [Lactifluus subvellereus]|nr:thiamine pyrophosphokinase [Lactifluus subvellereus]